MPAEGRPSAGILFIRRTGGAATFSVRKVSPLYAIVRSGGKQYRVEEGSVITVNKLAGKAGDTVTISEILFVADAEAFKAGAEALKGAHISAEIVGHSRGPKIDVLRYKNKTRQRKARGHRQEETTIRIMKFEG